MAVDAMMGFYLWLIISGPSAILLLVMLAFDRAR